MADILTRVFETFRAQSDIAAENVETSVQTSSRSALVLGDRGLSRSVLLLAAVTAASASGLRVLFLTQTQIQNLPVPLRRSVPRLNPAALKKIKFCYPRTLEELLVQVAGLHESTHSSLSTPALIIVDGLEGYLCTPTPSTSSGFNTSAQSSAAHLSALLCDTASFLSQVLEKQGSGHAPCRLIASFQPHETPEHKSGEPTADPLLDVLDRYFQVRCTLDLNRSYNATSDGFKQVWNIYLSGLGITRSSCKSEAIDDPQAHTSEEWTLLLFPDGLMEFKKGQKTERY